MAFQYASILMRITVGSPANIINSKTSTTPELWGTMQKNLWKYLLHQNLQREDYHFLASPIFNSFPFEAYISQKKQKEKSALNRNVSEECWNQEHSIWKVHLCGALYHRDMQDFTAFWRYLKAFVNPSK